MSKFLDPVGTYMTSPVHTIPVTATLPEVSQELLELGLSSLAVVDGDRLAGVVSYTDLVRIGRRKAGKQPRTTSLDLPDKPVSEIMTVDLIAVQTATTLRDAARQMVDRKIHRVYVLGNDVVVGVLSTRDLMYAVRDSMSRTPILELMSSPVVTIAATAPLSMATERLEESRVSGLVVVDETQWPIGIFSQREALASAGEARDLHVESAMSPSVLALPMTLALYRAAAQAAATRVRRVVVVEADSISGILTGLDFARAVADG